MFAAEAVSRRPPVSIDPDVLELLAIERVRAEPFHERLSQRGLHKCGQRYNRHRRQQTTFTFSKPVQPVSATCSPSSICQHRVEPWIRPVRTARTTDGE